MPYHIVDEHSECPASKPFALVKDDDGSMMGCHESMEKAEAQMAALHASENREDEIERRAPLEFRDATVTGVNFEQRVIEMVAAPYDEEATVEYRGELWRESFMRGAWDGIEKHAGRVRINRNHDKNRTVGKALNFYPSRAEGLVVEARIAPTDLGDETLALANEDMLSASAGFGVRGSDQILERPYRRIKRAFMDHIGFVESPAYVGARVLSVRQLEEPITAADLPKLVTPKLDEIVAWLKTRQA